MEAAAKQACEFLLGTIGYLINCFQSIYTAIIGIPLNVNDFTTITNPIGVSLASLFFALEAFSQMAQFRFERIEDAIRLGLKLVVAKIIIENSSTIAGGIYELFFQGAARDSITNGMADLSSQLSGSIPSSLLLNDGGTLGILFVIDAIFLVIAIIVVFVLLSMIAIQICGIVFEIAIHMACAPIALSTLCNDTARSTGISFIKSYSSVCLQGVVMGIVFSIYPSILTSLLSVGGMNLSGAGFFGDMFALLAPVLSFLVLAVTLTKTGEITKRLFGA